jgi:hypothetical protein
VDVALVEPVEPVELLEPLEPAELVELAVTLADAAVDVLTVLLGDSALGSPSEPP